MEDLFGDITSDYDNFTLFQDEAGCESNFFYHGYLLVDNRFGRRILDDILSAKGEKSKYSDITFKEIKKDDYRVRIVTKWLELVDEWLKSGKIRFFVLGVDKNNLKNLWDNSWSFEKNIYLRFFEIGLNSLIGWFKNDPGLCKPIQISHIFYEHGNYDDERKNKIEWLESLQSCEIYEPVYSNPKIQLLKDKRLCEMSNLIQLTDVLLGITTHSFVKINDRHVGKQKCVEAFIDVVERFNNKRAYNTKSRYYKRYALQFFPSQSSITKSEFLSCDVESVKKRGGFYFERPTYRQKIKLERNLKLI
jgi:hypothetical protein